MALDAEVLRPRNSSSSQHRVVQGLLLLSAVSLAFQTALTDYGEAARGTAAFWAVIGLLLLWLIYRNRSRIARGLVIVAGLAGAVIYGLAAFSSLEATLLMLAFLGQALPLLSPPIRRHVQRASGR